MPVQLKDPSLQEEHLKFDENQGVLEVKEIHALPENAEAATKYFAPKSYTAKTEFEQRKEKQRQHREWMLNIANQRNQMMLNKQKITEMVTASRNNNNGNGGVSL